MSSYYRAPVPPSLFTPGERDRFMRTFKAALRGWAAITSRTPRPEPRSGTSARDLVVVSTHLAASDVVELCLADPDYRQLTPWDPGAHIDVTVPSGRVRQYSLCGDPRDSRTYRIAVRHVGDGGVSAEIHGAVAVGNVLETSQPRNMFPYASPQFSRSATTGVVFIAGGIGITALLPMLECANRASDDWNLTYFGRSTESMPFLGRIRQISQRTDTTRILTTSAGGRPDVSELVAQVETGSAVYYCGPAALADMVRAQAFTHGATEFHFERFSPAPVVAGTAFQLHLASSATTITVQAHQTALDAALQHQPDLPYACRQGFCGSCRVRVIDGAIDKRGNAAFLDAPDTMLLCTDRSTGATVSIDR